MVMRAIDESGGELSDDDEDVDADELTGFAEHLGFSLPAEQDLMWICKMALKAPVPAGWTTNNDGEGNTYYYHVETGASSWDHPSDPYFRTLLRRCRQLKVSASNKIQGSEAAFKANVELNAQLDKLKMKYMELKAAAAKVGSENDVLLQRSAALEAQLADLRQHHAAEIEGLKRMQVDLRGKSSNLAAIEQENAALKAAAAASHEELERYRKGETVDLRARVSELEHLLLASRAELKVSRHESEEQGKREAELQVQLDKAHSTLLQQQTQLNKLTFQAEQQRLTGEDDTRRVKEEVCRLEAALEQERRSMRFAQQRLEEEATAAQDDRQRHEQHIRTHTHARTHARPHARTHARTHAGTHAHHTHTHTFYKYKY